MYSINYYHKQNRAGSTVAASIMMFFLSLSALNSIGFVPDYIDGTHADPRVDEVLPNANDRVALADLPQLGSSAQPYTPVSTEPPIFPTRIVAPSIGLDLPVLNPQQTSVAALDSALFSGVVRYPLSGKLNEEGNIFIFGHSTSVPIVKNQMFKAFNHISELRKGDTIKLVGESDGKNSAHIYRVTSVRRTDVDEALIDLSTTHGRRLTLSTCDSFGGKSSRFVVEAEFVASYNDE